MLAVGIDLIEVERVRRSLDRFGDRFLARIYTKQERRYCDGQAERLAARFALKEAVGKALGTGIGDVSWREIEVLNDDNGRPNLILHGSAQRVATALGLLHWSISLSHNRTQAVGMVVALRAPLTSDTLAPVTPPETR
jgi:holo-[acyl-carrier protein] synthase